MNPNCEIILSLGKQNIISKIAMYLTFNLDYHDDIRSTYKDQIEIFFKKTILVKKKIKYFFYDGYLLFKV